MVSASERRKCRQNAQAGQPTASGEAVLSAHGRLRAKALAGFKGDIWFMVGGGHPTLGLPTLRLVLGRRRM